MADKHEFDSNGVLDFCKKHIRYISAGAIMVVLVLVLAVAAGKKNTTDPVNKEIDEAVQEDVMQMEEFKEDSFQDIDALIENYYTAYAVGDIATMETYATPISDTEKSYIALMSEYIKEYKNIKCYTKAGLSENEYAVSVVMDMSFENAETNAPGLDFFYVKKNTEGVFYIDNLYSQFNLQNQEQPLDAKVEEFIEQYELQEDVLALCSDVENRYKEVMAADENLKNIAETVIPDAIQNWVVDFAGVAGDEQTQEEQQAESEQMQEEQQAESEQTQEEQQAESEQSQEEQVYVTENINVRKEPEETAEKLGSAIAGQELSRTKVMDNGWSEVKYDGIKAYVKSEYLSKEKPVIEEGQSEVSVNYVPEGIEITMNSAVNVRKTMDEEGERLGTTEIGDKVETVFSYAEGWTKVKWNDKVGYIKTELLLNN